MPRSRAAGCLEFAMRPNLAFLGMKQIANERSTAQVLALLTCLKSKGVQNKLAMIALAWAQLLAGTEQSILKKQLDLYHIWIP